jgi:hypothetical protein
LTDLSTGSEDANQDAKTDMSSISNEPQRSFGTLQESGTAFRKLCALLRRNAAICRTSKRKGKKGKERRKRERKTREKKRRKREGTSKGSGTLISAGHESNANFYHRSAVNYQAP